MRSLAKYGVLIQYVYTEQNRIEYLFNTIYMYTYTWSSHYWQTQ